MDVTFRRQDDSTFGQACNPSPCIRTQSHQYSGSQDWGCELVRDAKCVPKEQQSRCFRRVLVLVDDHSIR